MTILYTMVGCCMRTKQGRNGIRKWDGGFLSPWIAGFHLWDPNQPRPMVKIQN